MRFWVLISESFHQKIWEKWKQRKGTERLQVRARYVWEIKIRMNLLRSRNLCCGILRLDDVVQCRPVVNIKFITWWWIYQKAKVCYNCEKFFLTTKRYSFLSIWHKNSWNWDQKSSRLVGASISMPGLTTSGQRRMPGTRIPPSAAPIPLPPSETKLANKRHYLKEINQCFSTFLCLRKTNFG